MKISRIIDVRAQRDCQYRLFTEVDLDALDQCIAGGYDGYNERWVLAWALITIGSTFYCWASIVSATIEDIFDQQS